jgi:hypothetical protein
VNVGSEIDRRNIIRHLQGVLNTRETFKAILNAARADLASLLLQRLAVTETRLTADAISLLTRCEIPAAATVWLRRFPRIARDRLLMLASSHCRTAFFTIKNVARDLAGRTDRRSTDLARTFSDVVCGSEYLVGLFVKHEVIVAKMAARHVPVEVLGFHIESEHIRR